MFARSAAILGVFVVASCADRETDAPPKVSSNLLPSPTAAPRFTEVAGAKSLRFQHSARYTGRHFFPHIMGSGCALFDCDNDGDLDAYFVNFAGESPTDRDAANHLYVQNDDGRFEDGTETSGLGDRGLGMGVAVGDVNNDGLTDVYVTNFGPDRLYLNRGKRTFDDITESCGIVHSGWSTSACFFDYDRDGRLDLFVVHYVDNRDRKCEQLAGGNVDYCGPHLFTPTVDRLYRNVTGDGSSPDVRFEDVTSISGIGGERGPGLGVACADLTGDGWPDIYVANDQAPNYLWVNSGNGRFVEEALPRGCANDSAGRSQAGMGVAIGDVTESGRWDILLTHLTGESNALYVGSDEGWYADESAARGLAVPSLPFTGFGVALFDIEHDGDLDVVVANGRVKRAEGVLNAPAHDSKRHWANYAQLNQMYLNENGRFTEVSSPDAPLTANPDVSRGLTVGDIDNDGDLDVLISNTASAAKVYRNDTEKLGNWLQVRAVDPKLGGRDVLGSVVTVHAGDRKWVGRIDTGSSYLSAAPPIAHFGLGSVTTVDQIQIRWADGTNEWFAGGGTGRRITVEHGKGRRR